MMFRLFSKSTNNFGLTEERAKKLKELCKNLKIDIKALSLLDRALTHSSYIDKNSENTETYERLEFLGDSVLNTSIAMILFKEYPAMTEGMLSTYRSSLVDEKTLSEVANTCGIFPYINMGKGETLSDHRARQKVTADIIESIIAVIFLEKGFDKAFEFVKSIMLDHIRKRMSDGTRDFKTQLQKWAVAKYKAYPVYTVVNEKGPDHNKIFEVSVDVNGVYTAKSSGRTKKDAEQKAAEIVMKEIRKKEKFTGGEDR